MLIRRFSVALVAALALTGALFWFLHAMINRGGFITELKPLARIEFTRLRRDSDVQSRRSEKAKLEMASQVQAPPLSMATAGVSAGGVDIKMPVHESTAANVQTGSFKISRMMSASDRDVVPLVRIEPEYPIRAAQHGIEGWVQVRFTITPIGTVKDAVVVEAQPKGVFDDAAVRAVLRWKYNPKIEEGVAVERRGVQVVLRFTLEKEQQQ